MTSIEGRGCAGTEFSWSMARWRAYIRTCRCHPIRQPGSRLSSGSWNTTPTWNINSLGIMPVDQSWVASPSTAKAWQEAAGAPHDTPVVPIESGNSTSKQRAGACCAGCKLNRCSRLAASERSRRDSHAKTPQILCAGAASACCASGRRLPLRIQAQLGLRAVTTDIARRGQGCAAFTGLAPGDEGAGASRRGWGIPGCLAMQGRRCSATTDTTEEAIGAWTSFPRIHQRWQTTGRRPWRWRGSPAVPSLGLPCLAVDPMIGRDSRFSCTAFSRWIRRCAPSRKVGKRSYATRDPALAIHLVGAARFRRLHGGVYKNWIKAPADRLRRPPNRAERHWQRPALAG